MVHNKKTRYTCINALCITRADEGIIHKANGDPMSQQIVHVEPGELLLPLTC